ncbi:MAG: ATP synthase F1 subunit epsilon [Candidatus Magasanikbacteria bacterium]|jgi:F-type H+-transporting ATPase subunit epsilon|nr:ATP synthase F1 subunit epsilon [Candidatus Magasanikbacteria bacterium]MBT4221373.1 ATP synthase F1 subunit epsilon [Candidatus Magasanikbacteria bacterium]MBT4350779.1 ATP synthase F1 subunit epsilon [Candidatus Magasanikbacteria bacterium]MBT4541545.1 ATP synthase F1 subunit epsilon [Candidatus Magasanikbacteria bacterium]MBT6253497.1 ATP synthase F1 subunit epsilon [Candidatus Magasanikbacteria bacterium]
MITFTIVTPQGVLYKDSIDKVTIPTQAGAITVYPEHIPVVSALRAGELNIHKGNDVVNLAISTGVVEIRPNSIVYVLADTAERSNEIDVDRAELAKKRAEELFAKEEKMLDIDFARLQAKIEKEIVRSSVGRKYRNV